MKNCRKIINFIILLLSLWACDNVSSDKLIVVTAADNPPFEYIVDQEVVGFDIDLIKLIALKLNKKIEIKNLDLYSVMGALHNKSADLAIAALSLTLDRSKYLDFSDVYFSSKIAVLSKKESKINFVKDLEGKVIGVQTGTTCEGEAIILSNRIQNMKIRSIGNILVMIEELKLGNLDAVFTEEMQVNSFKNMTPGLQSFVIMTSEGSSQFAIAFPKGSDLVKEINSAISQLKLSGEVEKLKQKWLSKE